MVLFNIRRISTADFVLINVLRVRRRTGAHNVCWESFLGRIGPGEAWTGCWRKLIQLGWQHVRKAVAVRDQFARWNFRKHRTEELICSHESALHVYKNPYEIEREMDISQSSVWRIAKHDIRLKIYKLFSGLLLFDKWRHFIFQSCYEIMLRMK